MAAIRAVRRYALDNCGLTRVSIGLDGARLIVLNDGAHSPAQ